MQNSKSDPGFSMGLGKMAAAMMGAATLTLTGCGDKGADIQSAAPAEPQESPLRQHLLELAGLTSADAAAQINPLERRMGKIQHRDTLIDALNRVGAQRIDANGAVLAASEHIEMRRLRPGETFAAFFAEDAPETSAEETAEATPQVARLTGLSFQPDPTRHVLVTRSTNGDWISRELKVKTSIGHERVGGSITSSIYQQAREQGAGDQQVVDFAEVFAYDVDFQRQIRPNDEFEIFYEADFDERGAKVQAGELIYARINGALVKREFYRFTTPDDGVTDYYDSNGEAARKFLMKTPINGARLSSHYGHRKHPVLGYTKLHKGTDFAAPRGTPIYAAGNGVIERASRWGSYGNYVRIRHANGYQTAYAHMRSYGRGIKKGKRVKQGDIIGYVGTTGRSTGPHLHYEVIVNGKHVNAMRLNLPTGRKLDGEMLEKFTAEKARIDALRATKSLPAQRQASNAGKPA